MLEKASYLSHIQPKRRKPMTAVEVMAARSFWPRRPIVLVHMIGDAGEGRGDEGVVVRRRDRPKGSSRLYRSRAGG